MVIHEYAGIVTELEDHDCPHCGKLMDLGSPRPRPAGASS